MLNQSACNRRCRDLAGVLTQLSGAVAQELSACAAPYQALDTVAVPLMRRCRGNRHRLSGHEAAIGRGGSGRDWYYGCKLLLAVSPEGVITGFLLAPASTGDRWVGEAFFCWRNNGNSRPVAPGELPRRRNGRRYAGATGARWALSGGQRFLRGLVAGSLAPGLRGGGADAAELWRRGGNIRAGSR